MANTLDTEVIKVTTSIGSQSPESIRSNSPTHSYTSRSDAATTTSADYTMLPTHRALSVPELLLFYFEDLSGEELFAVALVSRDWARQALDTLWRTQEVPLSALLRQSQALGHDEVWYEVRSLEDIFEIPPDCIDCDSPDMTSRPALRTLRNGGRSYINTATRSPVYT